MQRETKKNRGEIERQRKREGETERERERDIEIYAVGSITWPHVGHFKVNNLATSRSITWPFFLSL